MNEICHDKLQYDMNHMIICQIPGIPEIMNFLPSVSINTGMGNTEIMVT